MLMGQRFINIKSQGSGGRLCPCRRSENGFSKIETPSEAYPEAYFADSSLGLDLYFN